MKKLEYLKSVKLNFIKALIAYAFYVLSFELKCYFLNTPFNYSILPPQVFHYTITYGIIIGIIISPLLFKKN